MTYNEVARLNGITDDIVDHDLRYIRSFIPEFAVDGFKIRELAYYQCFRHAIGEEKQGKRERGIRPMMKAIKQDRIENSLYNDLILFP